MQHEEREIFPPSVRPPLRNRIFRLPLNLDRDLSRRLRRLDIVELHFVLGLLVFIFSRRDEWDSEGHHEDEEDDGVGEAPDEDDVAEVEVDELDEVADGGEQEAREEGQEDAQRLAYLLRPGFCNG